MAFCRQTLIYFDFNWYHYQGNWFSDTIFLFLEKYLKSFYSQYLQSSFFHTYFWVFGPKFVAGGQWFWYQKPNMYQSRNFVLKSLKKDRRNSFFSFLSLMKNPTVYWYIFRSQNKDLKPNKFKINNSIEFVLNQVLIFKHLYFLNHYL